MKWIVIFLAGYAGGILGVRAAFWLRDRWERR